MYGHKLKPYSSMSYCWGGEGVVVSFDIFQKVHLFKSETLL
jgi:hypothetical protein